jgi:hypothetical protein
MDWLALFDQENVRFVVLDRTADSDLIERLRRRRGWIVDFEDRESMIFTRRSKWETELLHHCFAPLRNAAELDGCQDWASTKEFRKRALTATSVTPTI